MMTEIPQGIEEEIETRPGEEGEEDVVDEVETEAATGTIAPNNNNNTKPPPTKETPQMRVVRQGGLKNNN